MYYFNKITEKQKNYITGLLNKYTDLIKDIYYDNSISFLDKYTCRKFKSNDIMNYEANIIIAELKIINCLLDNIKLLKDNTKTTSHLSQDMKILNKFMTDKFNILDKFVFTPDISLVEKINLK